MNMLPIRTPVIMQLPHQNLSINQTCQANGVWEAAKTLGPGSLAEMRSCMNMPDVPGVDQTLQNMQNFE